MVNSAETKANWTDEAVSTLSKLWGEGLSAAQIASILGPQFSRNAVLGKAHRLKLPKPSGISSPKTSARPTKRRRESNGAGLAFSIARARKEAAAGAPISSAADAILGTGPSGASKVVPDFNLGKPKPGDVARLALMQITEHTCKWPIGDPLRPDFGFCGEPPIEGKPYCQTHARRAFNGVSGA